MAGQKQIIDLIKSISGQANILTIPRVFISLTGEINAALLLSQCIYWTDKGKAGGGWFYKSYREWTDEIGLTQYQIKRAAQRLIDMGLLQVKIKKASGAPTVHYKINMGILTNSIMKFLDNQETQQSDYEETSQSDYEETQQSLTETTQDTTQENTEVLPERGEIFKVYEEEIGVITPMIMEALIDLEKEYPGPWFANAVREAKNSTTRINLNYVKAILSRWKSEGLMIETHKKSKANGDNREKKIILPEMWGGEA